MLRRLFRRSQGPSSRTFQQDLDLYFATTLLKMKNHHGDVLREGSLEESEKLVAQVSTELQADGKGQWARLLRHELHAQMEPLMDYVEQMGGQDPYPVPKVAAKGGGAGGSVLEEALDFRGRDLNIEERPVAHWAEPWQVQIVRSAIEHREAGLGVAVRGAPVVAGSVVAIYPGKIWWPGKYGGPVTNEYAISRYDGIVVDALRWDELAREAALRQAALMAGMGSQERPEGGGGGDRFRNPFAVGSFVNHPPPGSQPNVMAVPYEFPVERSAYVPHQYASSSRPFYMFDYLEKAVPSIVLIATRTLHDEELYLNYRYNPALPYPDWYVQPNPEEAARRWAPHSFFRDE